MQKQGQLGLGDVQAANSTPRPISFLQYVMAYSVGELVYEEKLNLFRWHVDHIIVW